MLNRINLEIAKLAAKEENRFTMSGILVTPEATVVTDGHCLVKVTNQRYVTAENFPEIPNFSGATDEFKPFILDKASALEISKAIPKKESIPVLMTAAVGSETDVNGHAEIAVTDLERAQVYTPKKMTGTFPDYERCIPAREKATFIFGVNAKLLIQVLQQAINVADDRSHAVTLSFYEPDQAVIDKTPADEPVEMESAMRIDCWSDEQQFTGVVMPMRVGYNRPAKPAEEPVAETAAEITPKPSASETGDVEAAEAVS